ncbi:MAG: hypothetical protein EBU46_08690 [Nitrosomonadaceae bacterium]|nr:hypothetical protein [Nitrosomonadaceae bacterium]
MPNENDPLTPEEFEKLLYALDLTCQNVQRLLNQGIVAESLDDERITVCRRKMDRYRDQLRKEQLRVKRIQSVAKRRRAAQTRRK